MAKIVTNMVANAHVGVLAGRHLEVLFVFNHHAPKVWNQLEWEIRWGLAADYPLVTFPYFETVRDLNLNRQAVNPLANLMAWSLTTNETLARSMFGGSEQ